MDTKKLRFFTVLCETGHMREAAKLLNISHAGLSKAIHTLEVELGTVLVTKDGRGVRVTPEGRKLLSRIKDCLTAEENLLSQIAGDHQCAEIKIGTFEVFSTYLSPKFVQAMEKHTEVSFEELGPGNLETAIINGQVDFGITYLPIPRPNLDHLEITKIRMGIFGNKKFSAEKKSFEELPFVVPITNIDGAPTKVKGLDGWPDDRIQRNIKYSVSLMETALALSREGLAVGYFPKFVVELHNQYAKLEYSFKEFSPPSKISGLQPVYAVKRKDRAEDASFKSLCKVLRGLT
ncbi:MAG: LysR family transcriptional regulator [Bdellovibrionales bacterium]|nr:LysR family transcriptional regulator [Bdellovibrionales bacterium]